MLLLALDKTQKKKEIGPLWFFIGWKRVVSPPLFYFFKKMAQSFNLHMIDYLKLGLLSTILKN
jgi:hypothetical protein